MQTSIPETTRQTSHGLEAENILRSCVHCGFCNATCPTYQLLGDELDGPRGRIYQIKWVLEGNTPTKSTQLHLDRCLTCRACETTCPSGVQYGRLLDIGRSMLEEQIPRPLLSRVLRKALRLVLPYPQRFEPLLRLGQTVRPLLPGRWKKDIPVREKRIPIKEKHHHRKMLLLDGCVQPGLRPQINDAAIRVFDRLGITLSNIKESGCCGALSHHLGAEEEAKDFIRRNIDAWWPHVEAGAEAIVITASGCATIVKDYGYILNADPDYQDKAQQISALTKDISEIFAGEDLSAWAKNNSHKEPIAFHSPCTLQHGLKLNGTVESILIKAGFTLTSVPDSHLCCGSAGTYSILQGSLSMQLRNNKLKALQSGQPKRIVTANIGCLTHLSAEANIPVQHWIELFDTAAV